MNTSKLSQFCERALEAGWLLGVTITPVFFNVYSSRVFEPDKLTTLRSLAVIMAILWLVRLADHLLRGEPAFDFSWRTPLVLPAALTMLIYVISSIFSLVPYTSFIGSYQRLQGTYTLFAYLTLFFAILTSLRTRAQLSRLVTVLIINSLPVSLYGILQHSGKDPLPWAGDVQRRVASNMGNAIFVAAYLVMIMPLAIARIVESFRDILTRETARISDILRASGYIVIVVVQAMTIWYSRSRGPWLGFVAAAFLFPYLALLLLQQQAVKEVREDGSWFNDIALGLLFGVGGLGMVIALIFLGMTVLPGVGVYVGGILGGGIFGFAWLYLIVARKGWRWLWISWGIIGLAAAGLIVAINLPGPLQERVQQNASLRRLATISQLESGTGKVRVLIWQGAWDLVMPHEPIQFPDDSTDAVNFLRPLIGYGPESMYVAYNSFYPPELGHYESRTASPDRSHNETLDVLVITGGLGLLVYLFVFGSVIFWGLRWLGLLPSGREIWLYVGLNMGFALIFTILLWQLEGIYLIGVAIPLGMLVGTVLYLTVRGFLVALQDSTISENAPAVHPYALLLIAILAAVLAHFVEINFGISIASTRTTFWALAGLLVVLGLGWVPGATTNVTSADESVVSVPVPQTKAQARRKRRVVNAPSGASQNTSWIAPVTALSLIALFLLNTLAFDFINNPGRSSSAGAIFWNSLTQLYVQRTTSYGALVLLGFTWFLLGMIGLSELDAHGVFDQDRRARWLQAIGLYVGITLTGFLLFGGTLSGLQAALVLTSVATIQDAVNVAEQLAGLLGQYYGLLFMLLLVLGLVLVKEERPSRASGDPIAWGLLVILLLGSIFVIRGTNYNLVRADIIFKQGDGFSRANDVIQKQAAIEHYERALSYVPREDYYYLFLGKTYLEMGQLESDPTQQLEIFRQAEAVLTEARQIAPLNTDHSANLARFYRSMAGRSGFLSRAEALEKARENYHIALTLSPYNAILWNELAILTGFEIQDPVRFQEVISHSITLDPEFEQTWMLLGDYYIQVKQSPEEAIQAYQQALDIKANNCTVRYQLGNLLVQQQAWSDLVMALEPGLELCARDSNLWDFYRLSAIGYFYMEQMPEAFEMANEALLRAPEASIPVVEQLIQVMQAQQESQPTP